MQENIKEFLPIGTICMLQNATKPIMIIGYLPMAHDTKQIYDYTACLYPEGVLSSDQTAVFYHNQIKEIIHLGFENEKSIDFRVKLQKAVEEQLNNLTLKNNNDSLTDILVESMNE